MALITGSLYLCRPIHFAAMVRQECPAKLMQFAGGFPTHFLIVFLPAPSTSCGIIAKLGIVLENREAADWMGLALVHSRAGVGVAAPAVNVEVHLGGGLPRMSIVRLY